MVGRKPGKGPTMADVARKAGVSVTTVSHALNGSRAVADATRARIVSAAAELGYVPDDLLRESRTRGLRTVGLAMSAISNPYFGYAVQGIEETLSRAGYSILLAETHDDEEGQSQAVTQLLRKHVDAVILAPVGDAGRVLGFIESREVPVVAIDRPVAHDVDQVAVENTEPTARLVDHFAELGHQRIALIGGRDRLGTTVEREDGYRLGLRRNGLDWRADLHERGDSTIDGAAAALMRLLSLSHPPTALITANNSMTVGALRAAKVRGVRIPSDVALASFDDFEWAELVSPSLTAVSQPARSLGAHAAELVLSRLADPGLPPRQLRLATTFEHRESCGCAVPPPGSGLLANSAPPTFSASR
ncbi:MAG: LacI family DNA-binding transcriptional regulator [Propioniciclava sp.]|uniref:LacI family DNA-binding transcriptional regulator n=1 Tax=Propioniciclava sp. TaxID=2038686 RepID=UPI0039E31D04